MLAGKTIDDPLDLAIRSAGGGGVVTCSALTPEAFRRRAEVLAWQEKSLPDGPGETGGTDPLAQTLYELRVHQIELEMQNEELRQFQLDLDASRERFFDFYDMAPVGYCAVNDKGTVIEANLTTATLLGLPRDLLIKQTFSQFIEPADQDIYYSMRKRLIQTQAVQTRELRLRQSEGVPLWVSLTVRTAPTADQGPVMRIVLNEIAEHKRIETEAIAAKEYAQNIVETVRESLLVLDAELKILSANQSFYTTFQVSPEKTIGNFIYSLGDGQWDIPELRLLLEDILPKVSVFNGYEVEHVFPGIGQRFMLLNAREVYRRDIGSKIILLAIEDISESKLAKQLQSLAFFDPLTGLANRRLMLDCLQKALSSSVRHKKRGALMLMDLDNFKTLNDTLGHKQGDLLLQEVAKRLKVCVRDGDTVARLGGDEFVVMLEDLSENVLHATTQAAVVGQKILISLSQVYALGDWKHSCTASIGISLFGEPGATADELFIRADLAMYRAKDAGRNTQCFFDDQMQTELNTRVAMEEDLREAMQKQQFSVHYQAQVNAKGRITGVEALLRWQHPLRGWVPPVEFIPKAETTGLILPLGLWVLETACAQLARWATRPETAHLVLAVNVSARQFRANEFVDQVLAIVKTSGANAKLLTLELTEKVIAANGNDVAIKMNALKAVGIAFSLDDFDTGYSSLSHLKGLPLDQLKIDQSFVRNILSDPNAEAIAKTVIILARSMGVQVIAEGVETIQQRDLLGTLGCHNYQGYLFSKPLPVAEFEALVKRG